MVHGDGLLLVGNHLVHQGNLLGNDQLLVLSKEVLVDGEIRLQTYSSRLSGDPGHIIRMRLLVVPSTGEFIRSYFHSYRSLLARNPSKFLRYKYSDRKISRRFVARLHGFTRLTANDMHEICRRAGVLTSVLQQALKAFVEKCTTCRRTGRPLSSRKVSFRWLLVPFNNHVLVDFFFIPEMENLPILHMVDLSSAFSVTLMLETRELSEVKIAFEHHWVNVHGPPQSLPGDPEFDKGVFRDFLAAHSITFEPRPARRHNKMGVVESKNSIVRLIATRLLQDAQYFAATQSSKFTFSEILSRATFLSNVMYGGRKMSSFELVRGYTPSLMGLPQTPTTGELLNAYHEQSARRAIQTIDKTRSPQVLTSTQFPKDSPVYFFERGQKFGVWKVAYVRHAQDHSLLFSSNQQHQGPSIRAAYEYIRLVPKSALLIELDQMGFTSPHSAASPRSHSILHEIGDGEKDVRETNYLLASVHDNQDVVKKASIGFLLNETESSLWSFQPNARSLLSGDKPKVVELPTMDIGTPHNPPRPEKDVESTALKPATVPCNLQSAEQKILKEAKRVLGSDHVSEAHAEFLPCWIVEKAFSKEKKVYAGCCAELKRSSLPKTANIVSSHHFFHIEEDSERGALCLKCRLVRHGNRDREKEGTRKDSSSAQVPIIRLVLSIAASLNLLVGTLNITGAYLQGGELKRDIYMVPPRGWAKPGIVWKLLASTYGLVESGRLRQLTIERWMSENDIQAVSGLPQLFILQHENWSIRLLLAKVVDDLLLAGEHHELESFSNKIGAKFTVGKFECSSQLIFIRLRMFRHKDGAITINMKEYIVGE